MHSIKNIKSSVFRSRDQSPLCDIFADNEEGMSVSHYAGGSSRWKKHSKGKKKHVTWSTEVTDNAHVGTLQSPVIILCAAVIDGHMSYTIKIRQKDCEWNVTRRYSDFVELHSSLLSESLLGALEYPNLPKKRWFEIGRWTQRHNEHYDMERRMELQKYLQKLFSTHKKILVHKSRALHAFLEFGNRHRLSFSAIHGTSSAAFIKGGTDDLESEAAVDAPQRLLVGLHDNLLVSMHDLPLVGLRLMNSLYQQTCGTETPKAEQAASGGDDSESDSDSEDSTDSGFGEDDVRQKIRLAGEGAPDPKSDLPVVDSPSSIAAGSSGVSETHCTERYAWSVACFLWDLCKSDFWLFLIAAALLLLNKCDTTPHDPDK